MENKTFEFPQMIVLSRSFTEAGNSPSSPYHRCMSDCCFMD